METKGLWRITGFSNHLKPIFLKNSGFLNINSEKEAKLSRNGSGFFSVTLT